MFDRRQFSENTHSEKSGELETGKFMSAGDMPCRRSLDKRRTAVRRLQYRYEGAERRYPDLPIRSAVLQLSLGAVYLTSV